MIKVDDSRLGPHGGKIRCPRCANTLIVERPAVSFEIGLEIDTPAKPSTASVDTSDLEPELISDDDLMLLEPDIESSPTIVQPSKNKSPANATFSTFNQQVNSSAKAPLPVSSSNASAYEKTSVGSRLVSNKVPDSYSALSQEKNINDGDTRVTMVPSFKRTNQDEQQFSAWASDGLTAVRSISTAQDDFNDLMLEGGLSADGTFTAPTKTQAAPSDQMFPTKEYPSSDIKSGANQGDLLYASSQHVGQQVGPTRVLSVFEPQVYEPRSFFAIIFNIIGIIIILAIFAYGSLFFITDGNVDKKLLQFDKKAWNALWPKQPLVALDDMQIISMQSLLYPTFHGGSVLAFLGEIRNYGSSTRKQVQVTAQLRTNSGKLIKSANAPAGVSLGPNELRMANDYKTLADIYRNLLKSAPELSTIAPGATLPFSVIIEKPPPMLAKLHHDLALSYYELPKKDVKAEIQTQKLEDEESENSKPKVKNKTWAKGKLRGKARNRIRNQQ
ncbi:MAG: hypothetical protein JW841_17260 [Deltaproteobacteria bacterium]|nr:hypothetical protein [Deltaproteobacteria bacterium]